MKLLTKFNLILLVVFGAGGLIISQAIHTFLINNARREVLQEAELMMASARSMRDYTSSDLAPLLEQNPQHKRRFLAETVPDFSAVTIFNKLRQQYPGGGDFQRGNLLPDGVAYPTDGSQNKLEGALPLAAFAKGGAFLTATRARKNSAVQAVPVLLRPCPERSRGGDTSKLRIRVCLQACRKGK